MSDKNNLALSWMDVMAGVGDMTPEERAERLAWERPVRHRKRRSTHKRRTVGVFLSAQPWQYWTLTVVYAVCLLTVLLIVVRAISAGGQP